MKKLQYGTFDSARAGDIIGAGLFVHAIKDGGCEEMYEAQQTDRPAVEFALPDPSGQIHHSRDYRGRWLMLVFHRHLR